MSNPILIDYGSTFVVQASSGAKITAGSFSAGAQTIVNNTTSGNAVGAYALHLIVVQTSKTSSTGGTIEIYQQASHSSAVFAEDKIVATIKASTLDGKYHSAWVLNMPKIAKYRIKAVTRGVRASLNAMPIKQKAN